MTRQKHKGMKRRAPGRIFFGGDDDHLMWTWECRLPHPDLRPYAEPPFGDVWTFGEAVKCLEHHLRYCPEAQALLDEMTPGPGAADDERNRA